VSHLLDSNALVWWLDDSPRLSPAARAVIADVRDDVWVSAISVYELQVKARKGQLQGLPTTLGALVAAQRFRELPVSLAHAEAAAALPLHHRDPWDRLLIAQARIEGFAVVSADRVFARYGVRVVW
jgi:PIN domain nuclease of toxin-antitoxin system